MPESRPYARQRASPHERYSRSVPLPPPAGDSVRHVTEQRMRQLPSVTTDHSARVMSGRAQRAYDRWRDVDGNHVSVGAWVEQTVTDARLGALRSRLYRQGQVTSRGTTRLVVRFDGEGQTVTIRPHLIRVIERDDCGG